MTIRQLTFLAAILSSAMLATAQDQTTADPIPTTPTTVDVDQTHDDLRALRDSLVTAVNTKDVDTLLSWLHEDVILTAQDGDHLATIRKRDGVRDYLDRLLTGPKAGVQKMTVSPVVDEIAILHGDDTGIAYGHSTDVYVLNDGSEFTLQTSWSTTLVKTPEGWRVASLHVSSNLFDNPVLDALSRFIMIASCIAGLVGIVIGVAVATFMKRGRKASA